MFRALLCPSSGARQTAVAASGFRVYVDVDVVVFSAAVCREHIHDGHSNARNMLSGVCTTK
jgi:hypothetical protein